MCTARAENDYTTSQSNPGTDWQVYSHGASGGTPWHTTSQLFYTHFAIKTGNDKWHSSDKTRNSKSRSRHQWGLCCTPWRHGYTQVGWKATRLRLETGTNQHHKNLYNTAKRLGNHTIYGNRKIVCATDIKWLVTIRSKPTKTNEWEDDISPTPNYWNRKAVNMDNVAQRAHQMHSPLLSFLPLSTEHNPSINTLCPAPLPQSARPSAPTTSHRALPNRSTDGSLKPAYPPRTQCSAPIILLQPRLYMCDGNDTRFSSYPHSSTSPLVSNQSSSSPSSSSHHSFRSSSSFPWYAFAPSSSFSRSKHHPYSTSCFYSNHEVR